jgi:hypothetical protein
LPVLGCTPVTPVTPSISEDAEKKRTSAANGKNLTRPYKLGVTRVTEVTNSLQASNSKGLKGITSVTSTEIREVTEVTNHGDLLVRVGDDLVSDHPRPPDDRHFCTECRNLREGVCSVASPGAAVSANRGYRPVPDVLQRCRGYTAK